VHVSLSSVGYASVPVATANGGSTGTPDVNGDNVADDYVYCDSGPVRITLNCFVNQGVCPPKQITLPGTEDAHDLRFVDVNHDGHMDVRLTYVDRQEVFYQDATGAFSKTPPP
jgi:hypothetical protein